MEQKVTLIKTNNRLPIEKNSFDMPSMLDRQLYRKIEEYRERPGYSYLRLAEELKAYVHELYEDTRALVGIGHVDAAKLEKSIAEQIPSETYIRQYCAGRPICFRYTNTLANFFSLEYRICNFDPAKDFQLNNVLKG